MVDIWQLAKERLNAQKRKGNLQMEGDANEGAEEAEFQRRHESYIVICGSKNCGKSQMIMRFLDRNENTKPTIALEYTYGRRTRGMIKDVANIWELGGGTSLLNLFDIPLTKKNIEISSVLIVVDLSKPEQMWNTFYDLLNAIRKRLDDILNELSKSTPFVYERIMRIHRKRFSDHQDASMLKPLPIPLAIVGAKYDVFQNFEPENRKNICKILRFMAHSNFASVQNGIYCFIAHFTVECHFIANVRRELIYLISFARYWDRLKGCVDWSSQMFSTQMENLVIRCRALISHMVFGTTAVKTINTDFNKPLSIIAGSDCFEDIGVPSTSDSTITKIRTKNPTEMWQEIFKELFPQTEWKSEIADDPSADPQYKEPEIDKLVEQKLYDLEAYIKQKKDRQALEEKAEQQLRQQAESMRT